MSSKKVIVQISLSPEDVELLKELAKEDRTDEQGYIIKLLVPQFKRVLFKKEFENVRF